MYWERFKNRFNTKKKIFHLLFCWTTVFFQFINNFFALLLCKINVLVILFWFLFHWKVFKIINETYFLLGMNVRYTFKLPYSISHGSARSLHKLHNSEKIFKKFNLKEFERFHRFWSNLIPKVLDRCIIFVCIFRTVAQILRKLQLPQTFFKKLKIP